MPGARRGQTANKTLDRPQKRLTGEGSGGGGRGRVPSCTSFVRRSFARRAGHIFRESGGGGRRRRDDRHVDGLDAVLELGHRVLDAVALLDRAVSRFRRVHKDVRGAALVGLDEAVPFFKNVPEADAGFALL